MDSRSPASGALAQLGDFPHLFAARELTERRLGELRGELAGFARDEDAAVVMLGSWGRRELTSQSDDDFLVLVNGAERDAVRPSPEELHPLLGTHERAPGPTGVFGTVAFCENLVNRIGLDQDDNANLTRRMLLMLESVPVVGEAPHRACWERVLDAYLVDSIRDRHPPRFFLNDLIRYWRTICVDFEGKRRGAGGEDPKYASRNAKLRTSRKVLFAGGLLPVLLCQTKTAAEMPAFLTRQFAAPPTDRLAAAFILQGAVAEGVRALGAYDRWIGLLGDPSIRAELAALRESTREASPLFAQIREIGDELQRGLLALLYETGLSPLTRWYGLF
jgi:hypothetical protein